MSGRLQSLNVLVSAVWTAIFVLPVYLFCTAHVDAVVLYRFLFAASLPLVLPRSVLNYLQLSHHQAMYQRFRIPLLIRLTQDAPWLKRAAGTKSSIRHNRLAAERFIRITWMRERCHLSFAVFFALCSALALWRLQIAWAVMLMASNLLYNLYPIWLQQYLRLRIEPLLRR
jgi:hypothetical protein